MRQDESFERVETFIRFYNETMKRNAAANFYYFKKNYFFRLKELLGDSLKLFLAEEDGVVISASLVLSTTMRPSSLSVMNIFYPFPRIDCAHTFRRMSKKTLTDSMKV